MQTNSIKLPVYLYTEKLSSSWHWEKNIFFIFAIKA